MYYVVENLQSKIQNKFYNIGDKRSRKADRRLNSSDSSRDSWKICGAGEDVGSYFDLLYENLYTNHLTRSVLLF